MWEDQRVMTYKVNPVGWSVKYVGMCVVPVMYGAAVDYRDGGG